MRYCKKCVMPDTKLGLTFDKEGVCDACRSAERKHGKDKDSIDWEERRKEFEEVIRKYKSKDSLKYDCIIPVSGGKDSTYQTYMIKKVYGLNPLCVCFEELLTTELARKNLEALNRIGVDLIHFKPNPEVHEKMSLESFRKLGDNEWPTHLGLLTVPIQFAAKFKIPLIIWGECPQFEYGGPAEARNAKELDQKWIEEFGGLLGKNAKDMISKELGIKKEDLKPYFYPEKEELKGIKGIWLGQYFKWDVQKIVETIQKLGWKKEENTQTKYEGYIGLGSYTSVIHDYLKYVKLGFGRATDSACRDIRDGMASREEAVRIVEKYDGRYPTEAVNIFCKQFKITKQEFEQVCDKFTNKEAFENKNGKFLRETDGSLIMKKEHYLKRRNP